jgi:hypothetical protein
LTKAPKTFNGQKTASSTNIARKTGCLHAENSNIILVFHLVKVSTQSDLYLNIKPETLKLVYKRAFKLTDNIGNDLLNRRQMTQ